MLAGDELKEVDKVAGSAAIRTGIIGRSVWAEFLIYASCSATRCRRAERVVDQSGPPIGRCFNGSRPARPRLDGQVPAWRQSMSTGTRSLRFSTDNRSQLTFCYCCARSTTPAGRAREWHPKGRDRHFSRARSAPFAPMPLRPSGAGRAQPFYLATGTPRQVLPLHRPHRLLQCQLGPRRRHPVGKAL